MLVRLRFTLLCVFSLLSCASWAQTTINVGPNQPYTTIQSGINAAQNGDTVLVAPGTYNEHIDFKGKAITVTSAAGSATTIIDGGTTDRAVSFKSGETRSAILSGFTIQHGGTYGLFSYLPIAAQFGAVYVSGSSPTIRNNTFTQNACWAIYSEAAAPLIQSNTISATQDEGQCNFATGSAVYIAGNLHNSNSTNDGSAALLTGNTIENNTDTGYTATGDDGGAAVYVYSGSPVIMNNVIRNNADPGGSGTAIASDGAAFGLAIVQNLIYNNASGCGGGALGLGVNPDTRTGIATLVANNTIIDNTYSGGANGSNCTPIAQIYPDPVAYGSFVTPKAYLFLNNIIAGATSYPAVNCDEFGTPIESSQPSFENNILYNAGGPFFGNHCVDVSGIYNNIAGNPLLVSPSSANFQPSAASPAIDSGQNKVLTLFHDLTGLTLTTDIAGNPRLQGVHGGACTIDMGAYEYTGSGACGTAETLTSSANPSSYNQAVTFSATLSAASGTPTGSVQFSDGGTVLGTQTVSASGASAFTTSQLTVGTHTITAAYQATGNFPAATATVTQIVNGYPTTTQLTSSLNPATVGQTVTFTVTVSSTNGTPGGSVTFSDGSNTLAVVPLNAGTASYTTSTLAIGSHPITAALGASGVFAGSSASLTELINGQPTSTTLSVTPNPLTAFGTLTLTSAVSATPGTPSGTVTFNANGVKLGTAPLSGGQAALTVPAPAAGTYSIVAVYSGDASDNPSTSPAVTETVIAATSAISLTAALNPAYQGQAVTLSASVAGVPGQIPTGTVAFYDGSSSLGTAPLAASGTASINVTTLAPGTHTLTAMYQGSASYAGSTSAAVQEQILPGSFGITLSPATMTLSPGKQGTVQVNLSSINGFSGPLQLSVGTLPHYAIGNLSPATVTLTAGSNGTANLLLNASTARLQPAAFPGAGRSANVLACFAVLLLPLRLRYRGRLRGALGVLLLAALLTGASGCGIIRIPFQTAAPGSYQIPITATDANQNSRSATPTLNVTQ